MNPPQQQLRAVHCTTLFDGRDVIADATIEIDGDRVTAVRTGGSDPPADGGSVAHAAFAMPGLIDGHAHCIGDGNLVRLHPDAPLDQPASERSDAQVDAVGQLFLLAGVTTVRDVGNHLRNVARARAQSPDSCPPELARGPRVAAAGPLLGDEPLVWRFTRVVPDEQHAATAVHELAAAGVDLICAYRGLDVARVAAVIRAAAEHGLPVAVNTIDVPAGTAAALGARSVEHATFLLDDASRLAAGNPRLLLEAWSATDPGGSRCRELAEQLACHRTFVVPTLVVARRWALFDEVVGEPMLDWMLPVMPFHRHLKRMRSPWGWRIGKHYLARYLSYREPSREQRLLIETGFRKVGELVCRLLEAGVPIALGTDSPTPSVVPGFSVHAELRHLVDVGLSPREALVAATSAAAELVGRDDVGRIGPGSLADLALFDASPVDDIDHLRHLRAVVLGGCLVDRDAIAAALREAAARAEAGQLDAEEEVARV